jgi:hypothetical protein
MSTADKHQELTELRSRVRELESELAGGTGQLPTQFSVSGYYAAYYATTGFLLGSVAAMSSLLVNVIGSLLFDKNPLELIRVYLTFPMGKEALNYDAVDNGVILAIGCCLYLATGMAYGVLFQIVLTRFTAGSPLGSRFVMASLLAIAIWLINYYCILSWLQPMLFGGNWIVERIPWWVAAATHLVFGWSMLILYPLGRYTPYHVTTENS